MTLKKSLFYLTLLMFPLTGMGQQTAQDTEVRRGKLDNGLTYYIRHNAKEPKLAEFYIAQRVGSILEEPHQRGLAHFLEHMAFNGTEHFRGEGRSLGIVPWCESIGVKFGANLNAYTSVDQTVYNISAVPVSRESIADSCLLVLHDWSNSLLLTDKEIDKERGVIHEEWRTRRTGMAVQRLMERSMPAIYKGSKYEDCLPIGSMDVVDNFKPKALRDYYKKWYRPDLQAIIVVGDIDVDRMEKKIKELFSPIKKQKNPAERIYYPVPDNERMIVSIEKDKEQPITITKLYMKRDATPDAEKGTVKYQRDGYKDWLVSYMLNQRLTELTHRQNPPFINATASNGTFFVSRTKDAFAVQVGCKQEDVAGSMTAAFGEVERLRQHGFTEAELRRAKAKYLASSERRYAERNDRKNSFYVGRCLRNFLTSEPMITDDEELSLAKTFDKEVSLAEVNEAMSGIITNKNQVLTVYAPEKEGLTLPTAAQFESIILAAQSAKYEPYKEEKIDTELMKQKPSAGKIISEKDYGKHDTKVLTLSNGVKVYVKQTDFSKDQVIMKFFGKGGTSNLAESDVPNLSFVTSVATESGVGDVDVLTLRKMLADKIVKVNPFLENETQGISGSCAVKDVETMLQLANLYITAPRFEEETFGSIMQRRRALYKNREASPTVVYNDSVAKVLYGDSPRTEPIKLSTLEKVKFDRLPVIYKELLGDVSGFDLIIIGNMSIDSLRPLLCTYIASLPANGKAKAIADTYPAVRKGNETHLFLKDMQTSSSTVTIYYPIELPFSAETDLKLDMLKRVLQIAYTDSIREEKGGTYGVGVSFDLDKYSKPDGMLRISFRCDPKRYAELMPAVYAQLQHIADNGPAASSMDKVKKFLKKQYGQFIITNDYWRYVLYNELYAGEDFDTGYTELVDKITAAQIQSLAADILKQNRRLEITMKSE